MVRRIVYALALVVSTHALLAQVPANPATQPDAAQKPPGNCTVSGRVLSAAEGAPLSLARVGLIQPNVRKHPLVYMATTDNEGRFEIKQIEAGHYRFFASHAGYLKQEYKAQSSGVGEGAILSLVAGQEVTEALFRLVRAAIITGKVVDDNGAPITGATVSVLRRFTEEEKEDFGEKGKKLEVRSVSEGVTDDRGEYRIFGLTAGDYYVKAADTGNSPYGGGLVDWESWTVMHELGNLYAPIYYPGVLQLGQAQTVTVRAGEEIQADFSMRPMKTTQVAGRVIGVDGSPASQASVSLMPADVSDYGTNLYANTDNKGEFSIKGVTAGSYVLYVNEHEENLNFSAQRKVEVGEEKLDSIVIAVGRGATIHGRIVASGARAEELGRLSVSLSPTSDNDTVTSAHARANKDGSFELNGVGDGNYSLLAYGFEQGWYLQSVRIGSEDALQKGVLVENGAAAGNLSIILSNDGAQVEGTVTDSDQSRPLAGVQVKARPDPPNEFNRFPWYQASTDQNGHFIIKDLPPGKYKVTARIPSPGEDAPAIKSDPVAVTLGEREYRTLDIKLTLPKSE